MPARIIAISTIATIQRLIVRFERVIWNGRPVRGSVSRRGERGIRKWMVLEIVEPGCPMATHRRSPSPWPRRLRIWPLVPRNCTANRLYQSLQCSRMASRSQRTLLCGNFDIIWPPRNSSWRCYTFWWFVRRHGGSSTSSAALGMAIVAVRSGRLACRCCVGRRFPGI